MADDGQRDSGADGLAATSRRSTIFVVLGDERSQFRDSGVEVRRYEATCLDVLRNNRQITYDQYTAGRWALALWRQAGLAQSVTSRYEEWTSGGRGSFQTTDDSEDEASPWRELLSQRPRSEQRALENMAMGCLRGDDLEPLIGALSAIAAEQARTKR